ncbi:hypothetical protein A2765_05230 [Candidatus Kaiserbacteria bacterium RIFCSPHIGHO2_01_FULL_56_24]|uniref:histidine kinase n=1 Tax=Candidatus Kaiserbacteria bacterium RIFCSPHIGHO2_01_FULL_56_24 TaxID=1798487 RepID=A0A1F6D8S5_9BACT|nr:MAG: hypothetical protein A2765_05230 [Candidatus Kaiserbacteria bacterium RIFCSPHIGHO2_01_FULL_56_24]
MNGLSNNFYHMEPQTKKLRTLVWAGSFIALAAVVFAIVASVVLYEHTINLLTDNLRQRLLSISTTQAANINAESLEALQVEADWIKPEWADVVSRLKKAKNANPNIVFMYIFRHDKDDPTQMEFVADAGSIDPYANLDGNPNNDVDANGDGIIEPDGADKLQWPGQDYTEAIDIPESFEAYNGPLTAAELYEDSYGQVLTGYAPIEDANGNTVAVLATDIKADDFFTVTRQTLYPFVIFIVFLTLIIAVLAIALIYIWERRAEMLAQLSRELEIANRQQENLLAFISHEVKGYLAKSAASYAGILQGDYGNIPEPLMKMADGGLIDMRKGVDMVGDILDASNLRRGTVSYDKREFDLKKSIEEVIHDLKAIAQKKGVTLEFAASAGAYLMRGDEAKMRRHVIRNLVENSIHYTPSGSITVSLSRNADMIHFSVKDTGVGITKEDMQNLFTEGGRGKESTKVNVDSTGYGLFIAKQVTEAHDGRISADSKGKGKGSEFVVEFPAA